MRHALALTLEPAKASSPLRCSGYRFKGFVDTDAGRRAVVLCDGGILATCTPPLSYTPLPSGTTWTPARMTPEGWVPTGEPVVVPVLFAWLGPLPPTPDLVTSSLLVLAALSLAAVVGWVVGRRLS